MSSQKNKTHKVDITIVGAGIVGLSVANLLKDLPIKVALIEAHDIPAWNGSDYDLRISAISKASEDLFKTVDVWSAIQSKRVSPYQEMMVWETALDGQETLEFSAATEDLDNLGHIIENSLIRDELNKKLAEKGRARLQMFVPDKLASVETTSKHCLITLQSGEHIESKLLIAADGASSTTRQKLGLSTVSRSYEQGGVVANLKLEKPHYETAYQRFVGNDILAFLPLEARDKVSMVWSVSNEKAEAIAAMDKDSIAKELTELMQNEFGAVTILSDVRSFPLQMLHAGQYVDERVVLCGDAAHAIHPLAGQGVNIGLLDAKVLSDVLHQAWKDNYDLGDLSVLRRYERERKSANVRVMAALDALYNLFQEQEGLLSNLRRFGMGMVNRVGFVKRELMQHALGLR